jgi:voltage-gated potassium channel
MHRSYQILHKAFHEPQTRLHTWVQGTIWVLILLSVGLFVTELAGGSPVAGASTMGTIDTIILWFFGVEICLRVGSFRPAECDFYNLSRTGLVKAHLAGRLKYTMSPMILVDLLTVLALVPEFRGLRAMRLLRLVRQARFFKYSNLFASVGRAFSDNQLVYVVAMSLLGTEVLLGGITIFLAEARVNPDITQLADGFWWAAVTLTTVGFGDITPITPLGRFVGLILMVGGMFTLALFAAIVGSTMLSAVVRLREEQIRMSDRMGHIVVCGYDPGAQMLLDALQTEFPPEKEILLFSGGAKPLDLSPRFQWIPGDPTKESELGKVSPEKSECIIVVGSREVMPQAADATTILTAFTLRSFLAKGERVKQRLKPPYIIAEILDAENVEHARAAGADEVVESTRIGFSLIAHSALEPGTAAVMSAVATHDAHSLHMCDPRQMPIKEGVYGDYSAYLMDECKVLAIGIKRLVGGDLLNPDVGMKIAQGDLIIYLADGPIQSVTG